MATVNLGNIKFKWKGTYNGATAYTIDDVVEYNGSSYICKLASTGNLPTNTTYFDVMSQAGTNGTNGTDVGTVITTQGDLVYRDGSGLQRLGAGTAGQVLQTGGAGANPSWTNLSSDFVKLAETTVSSGVSSVGFDGYFSSTYDRYEIVCSNFHVDSVPDMAFRVYIANSEHTSNQYVNTNAYQYTDTTPTHQIATQNSTSIDYGVPYSLWQSNGDNLGSQSTNGCYVHYTIYNPLNTTDWKMMEYLVGYGQHSGGVAMQKVFGHGVLKNTSALTGMLIIPSAGNITSGTFKLYGYK